MEPSAQDTEVSIPALAPRARPPVHALAPVIEWMLGGAPPALSWVTYWASCGADPVSAAWESETDDQVLRDAVAIARGVGRTSPQFFDSFCAVEVSLSGPLVAVCYEPHCIACCVTIRGLHTPLTLADVARVLAPLRAVRR